MTDPSKPLITTVIPTYRRPQLLKRAIQSVLRQTRPHFRVCVYDNASGDETASVVAELAGSDPRVNYYCHAENIGALENFQFGLKRVETPFFSFLSDDDIVLPDFHATALAAFDERPEVMFAATDVVHLGINNNILKTSLETWTPGYYDPPNGLLALLEHGHSEWTGILFRKEITDAVGFLDRSTGKFSDLDFTLRSAARCPFAVIKRPCAVFNLSMAHTAGPYLFDDNWPGVLKMIRNLTDDEDLPADVRAHAERVLLERFERGLFESGLSYLSRGYSADAIKVAALLHDQFGAWARYVALSAISYAHQYVPCARWAFDALVACRRFFRAKRLQSRQDRYSQYTRAITATDFFSL